MWQDAAERKGKNVSQQPDTTWWHVRVKQGDPQPIAAQPLAYPPNLTSNPRLRFGDLFYHRSVRGIQLWLWSETATTSGEWRPVLLGISRTLDGRLLGLTGTLKPSWVKKSWYRRMNVTGT